MSFSGDMKIDKDEYRKCFTSFGIPAVDCDQCWDIFSSGTKVGHIQPIIGGGGWNTHRQRNTRTMSKALSGGKMSQQCHFRKSWLTRERIVF